MVVRVFQTLRKCQGMNDDQLHQMAEYITSAVRQEMLNPAPDQINGHLPECFCVDLYDPDVEGYMCICSRLQDCELRTRRSVTDA